MYTHDVSDRFTGLSASDLAQRLVELSSRGTAQGGTAPETPSQPPLPRCVSALLWDAKSAGAAPPRTALLRGDEVELISRAPDATLSCITLSENVRFRFALSRRRHLSGILSSTAALSFRMSTVDATHFYWMDECAPKIVYGDASVLSRVLQKRIAQWVVSAFTRNPLLRNISLQTLEAVFPALLVFSPREREEFLSQAAELLGQGMLIWYGGAVIKQFHDSAVLPSFALLTPNEERCVAAWLFALATAREILGDRRDDAARALRALVEVYGTHNLSTSPALTTAVLLVSRAIEPLYTPCCAGGGPPQRGLHQPYLFALSRVNAEVLQWILPNKEPSSPDKYRELVQRLRDAVGAVLVTAAPSLASTAPKRQIHEEDVNAFFSANRAVEIDQVTLIAHCVSDAPSSLPTFAEAVSGTEARLRLLEAAPKWWENEAKAKNGDMARGETELRINMKAAAAALSDLHAADHAILSVIHRTRKRQRTHQRHTSQAVEGALETASIQLKRKSVRRLVDILALSAEDEDFSGKAWKFLEHLHVPEAKIDHFATLLSTLRRT
ncbi:hypothetical protein JKF63_02012 [Porcisia hertigi]|uniref:Uncharacterized protein n=1 Tax=Porcisia hertigi TaxID=2761500 RepID=A0A836HX94_9TRYP|nr:hypothetical protein JKF63_02012 [Porcisia hertigi]